MWGNKNCKRHRPQEVDETSTLVHTNASQEEICLGQRRFLSLFLVFRLQISCFPMQRGGGGGGGIRRQPCFPSCLWNPAWGCLLFHLFSPLTAQTNPLGIFCLISFLSSQGPSEASCASDKTVPPPHTFLCRSVRTRVADGWFWPQFLAQWYKWLCFQIG